MPEVLALIVPLPFIYDDGGREEAGFRGKTGDCSVRAVAIATGVPYKAVYQAFKKSNPGKVKGILNYSGGTPHEFIEEFLLKLGWRRKFLGSSQKLDRTLPMGRIIVSIPKHTICIIDHIAHDTFKSPASSPVFEYWYKNE
jgi:hypothetical protein